MGALLNQNWSCGEILNIEVFEHYGFLLDTITNYRSTTALTNIANGSSAVSAALWRVVKGDTVVCLDICPGPAVDELYRFFSNRKMLLADIQGLTLMSIAVIFSTRSNWP